MKKTGFFLVWACFFILLIIGIAVSPASAQSDSVWLPQQQIPGYDSEAWPPILVADRAGTVHAFTYFWLNGANGPAVRPIMYSKWNLEQGWTAPVDILLSPYRDDARLLDAFIDQTDRLNLIFWGGNNIYANIYYSSAPVAEAENARAWTAPILVAENAGDPETGAFSSDEAGRIYLLYSGRNGNGVYSTTSDDHGITWTKPSPIYLTNDQDKMPQALHIYKGQSGWLHAIWNVITSSGQGRQIYYSHLKLGDTHWSNPILLAAVESGYGTNTPNIIEYRDEVFAFYNMTPKIMMRLSKDGGQTWESPVIMFPRHVGVNGTISFVIDNNNDLHILFGQRIESAGMPAIHGMWHSQWNNRSWTKPDAVVSKPKNNSFDPYQTQAVVCRGNIILVTWRSDFSLVGNGVWYSYKVLDAPATPLKLLSNIDNTPLTVTKPLSITQPISNSASQEGSIDQNPPTPMVSFSVVKPYSNNPSMPLIISVAPPAFVTLVVIIIFFERRTKSMHSIGK